MAEPFDVAALWVALDERRRARGTTWAAVAREIGVSPSTLARARRATDLEADGMVQMTVWLGVAPEAFCRDGRPAGAPVPPADGPGILRVDTAGLHAALDHVRAQRGLAWTAVAGAMASERATPGALRGLAAGGRVSTQVLLSATGWLGAPCRGFLSRR